MNENAMKAFMKRFREILDGLDALDMDEELEELNAQMEDTLFFMESIDPDDADAGEEFEGAFEELSDIAEEYVDMAGDYPGLGEKAAELKAAIDMAKRNM